MKKNNSIPITTASAPHTIAHPAIATVHLINQSPGVELVGGVTLYFEPVGTPSVTLIPTQTVDASYGNAVAQGVHHGLDALDISIAGVRIWWCDWLWHPIDSKPRAFTHAAKLAITKILPWLTLTEFIPEPQESPPNAHLPFANTIFEQHSVSLNSTSSLNPPVATRWTIKTPLISHTTRAHSTHISAPYSTDKKHLIGAQSVTQITLAFKAIASTQRVCPVDKLTEFHRENGAIFNAFADTIRTQIPNARGFDVMVQELTHKVNRCTRQPSHKFSADREVSCLAGLTSALQQAINVRGKSYY